MTRTASASVFLFLFLFFLLTPIVILLGSAAFGQDTGDPLQQGFAQPPQRAKPGLYLYWLNGHLSKQGMTKDLEAMADVGLGSAVIANYEGMVPRGPVTFMTPEWHEFIAHSMKEADRLGIEVAMHNGNGWSGAAGPWIMPEKSMQEITFSETTVQGPGPLSEPLPRPFARKNYYRDIGVYAFRIPAAEGLPMRQCSPRITSGGSQVNPLDLTDGDYSTSVFLPVTQDTPTSIDIEFPEPFTARSISIVQKTRLALACEVQVSNDGKRFTKVSDATTIGIIGFVTGDDGYSSRLPLASFPPAKGRFFRISFPAVPTDIGKLEIAELELISGARIHDSLYKAGFVRGPVEDGAFPAAQQDEPGTSIPLEEIVDVTSRMEPHGTLSWDVPAGKWTILRIGHTTTGVTSLRGPMAGQTLDTDKMSKEVTELHFDHFLAKAIADSGDSVGKGKGLAHAFIESWEVGSQNWTPKFSEEFQKRRGYDPLPYLPAVIGWVVGSREVSERFLFDVRLTIADLIADNYFGHLQTLSERHGMGVYSQAYGAPQGDTYTGFAAIFNNLQCFGRTEVPMAEFWIQPEYYPHQPRQAASAAHTYGRRIADSEAFTSGPPFGNFQNYPYAMKTRGDRAFTDGINRLTITGGSHQPWPNVVPGMMCGVWAPYYDRNITWWDQSRAWIAYLTRCQYLLQEGLFAADVCYSVGEGAPKEYEPSGYAPELPPGYEHDVCTTEVIHDRMSVEGGRIVLPDGMSYRLLVLPDTDHMTPEMAAKIRDLVSDGAIVMGRKPVRSPSLSGYPDCDNEVKRIADDLWGGVDGVAVKERTYGKGKIIWGKMPAQIFSDMDLKPDFQYRLGKSRAEPNHPATLLGNEQLYTEKLNAIHRIVGKTDLYFVASQSERQLSAICTFRVNDRCPEFWYPDTGRIEKCARYRLTKDGRIEIPIWFDPSRSLFVVFREPIGDSIVGIKKDGKTVDELSPVQPVELHQQVPDKVELLAREAGSYELLTAKGKSVTAAVPAVPASVQIDGPWKVRFQKDRGAPPEAAFETLISWPQHRDAGIKYFSGTATYVKDLTIPAEMIDIDLALYLDLGRVEVIASAELNGQDLGILWKPPFRTEITALAKPGKNALEVTVTNLWPNRMIGDEQYPSDAEYRPMSIHGSWWREPSFGGQYWSLTAVPDWVVQGTPRPESRRVTFGTHKFWEKSDPLLPSGLLGPVTVQAAAKKSVSMTGDQP